jgi:hypothetical protein
LNSICFTLLNPSSIFEKLQVVLPSLLVHNPVQLYPSKVIYIAELYNEKQKLQIEERLMKLYGVFKVSIDIEEGAIFVDFETPANLNNIYTL